MIDETPLPPALDAVAKRARAREDAESDFIEAVLEARKAGETLEAIGDAAGLSKQRIGQIVAEYRYPNMG